MQTKHQKLLDEYPFLTVIEYAGKEYLGIVQNIDSHVASVYIYERLANTNERVKFLQLGEEWWWGTNRMIPINIIFKSQWSKYRSSLVTFSLKDFQVVHGPTISLSNICQKRIKRRNIQLVRKVT